MSSKKPTITDHAVSMIMKTAASETAGLFVPTSHKLPVWLVAECEAMAEVAATTRAEMMSVILESGLQNVKDQLPEEVLGQIQTQKSQIIAEKLQKLDKEGGK